MAFVVIYSLATRSLNEVEEVWGLGLTALGLLLSFVSSGRTALFGRVPFISTGAGRPAFFTDPSVSHGDTVEAELAAAGTGAPLDPGTGPEQTTVTDYSTVIDDSTVTIDDSTVTDSTAADGSDRDELWKKRSIDGRNRLRGA
jgi:hypothetical protein